MPVTRRAFLQTAGALAAGGLLGAPALSFAAPPKPPRTLREKVGQLFVVSFAGTTPAPSLLSWIERYHFGGVILFTRNYTSPGQLKVLLSHLQGVSSYPLLVCTDQEGGLVVRLRNGVHTFPSEATYGQVGSASRVYNDATTTARDLHPLGLTMNLAPVVDVLTNPQSPIGTRSYGPNPQLDARLSVAAIKGYQQHRLAATAKHFIGLGHTSVNSHQALPVVSRTLAQLQSVDLIPFRAAIAAGVSTILVAHVALPAIDPVHRPASLSPVIIGNLIRKQLGFNGVVMTDSLIMGAINIGTSSAAQQAFAAGADILLIAKNTNIPEATFDDAYNRVLWAVQTRRIPESHLDSAVNRILALKRAYPATVL